MAFFGIFYVAVMFSYLYQTRMMADGAYLVWLIFLSSWGCDTCAYCVGMLFGKHKLAPVLSPKKSIEGAVGGVIGAAFLGFLYALFFGSHMNEVANPTPGLLHCLRDCGRDLPDRRSGGLSHKAKPPGKGLRPFDPRARGSAGSV